MHRYTAYDWMALETDTKYALLHHINIKIHKNNPPIITVKFTNVCYFGINFFPLYFRTQALRDGVTKADYVLVVSEVVNLHITLCTWALLLHPSSLRIQDMTLACFESTIRCGYMRTMVIICLLAVKLWRN